MGRCTGPIQPEVQQFAGDLAREVDGRWEVCGALLVPDGPAGSDMWFDRCPVATIGDPACPRSGAAGRFTQEVTRAMLTHDAGLPMDWAEPDPSDALKDGVRTAMLARNEVRAWLGSRLPAGGEG